MILRKSVGLEWQMTAVMCDRVGCGTVLPVRPCLQTKPVRGQSAVRGWVIVVQNPESKHRSRSLDFCPACAADREKCEWVCPVCAGGGLHDVMGHDPLGHRVARALHTRGLLTGPDVARLSRADLMKIQGFGPTAVERVLDALEDC